MTDQQAFSLRNRVRCEHPQGFNKPLTSWNLDRWFTALIGEIGEAANVIKKLNRIEDGIPGNRKSETEEVLKQKLADELADTICYLDLLVQRAGLDWETIRDAKFAKTSQEIGYVEESAFQVSNSTTLRKEDWLELPEQVVVPQAVGELLQKMEGDLDALTQANAEIERLKAAGGLPQAKTLCEDSLAKALYIVLDRRSASVTSWCNLDDHFVNKCRLKARAILTLLETPICQPKDKS